jgi:hypothetical protein
MQMEPRPTVYPQSMILFMAAINERVPVLEGTFRIRQDVKVSSAAAFSSSLGADGKDFTINGSLRYQACDSKTALYPLPCRSNGASRSSLSTASVRPRTFDTNKGLILVACRITFSFGPAAERAATVDYLSTNPDVRRIRSGYLMMEDAATAAPREFQIRLRQPAAGVLEASINLSATEAFQRLLFGLTAMVGHAIYL